MNGYRAALHVSGYKKNVYIPFWRFITISVEKSFSDVGFTVGRSMTSGVEYSDKGFKTHMGNTLLYVSWFEN